MGTPEAGDVTRLLNSLGVPGEAVSAPAFDVVYAELKSIAAGLLARESDRGVLETTVLVHDALLKLRQFERTSLSWENRAHFFGTAAKAMRQILVDEARRRRAHERAIVFVEQFVFVAGGEARPVEIDMLDLDEALVALHEAEPRLCEIISLRVFGELGAASIAYLLNLSEDQVRRRTRLAQAWLIRWLRDNGRLPEGRA
ncbi:MAG: ECF-type sigma factor [Planctomycetota bacterium]|nr:ECF-type sigma factor [Planctomycetota bacterium]